jgi:hypothetical protein
MTWDRGTESGADSYHDESLRSAGCGTPTPSCEFVGVSQSEIEQRRGSFDKSADQVLAYSNRLQRNPSRVELGAMPWQAQSPLLGALPH